MDGLEVMQGYGCWYMEVCLMRKWRDIWLVGLLSKCYKIMDRTSICTTMESVDVNGNQLDFMNERSVRADLGGHLKYSQRWSGVCAGVLLGAQGTVRRGKNRGGL